MARRPPERVTRILVAVSGEGATEVVVRAAVQMAAAFGAQCSFLHVSSEVALPYHTAEVQAASAVGPAEAAARARDVVAKAFPTAEYVVHEGLVVDEILDAFEGGAHHLLVVGGQGEEEPLAWGRENVTERLLLACPGSTLIVPRQG